MKKGMTITIHNNRLSTFFSTFGMDKLEKIHQLRWKSYVLKTNKDIISSSKLQNLQMFVYGGGRNLRSTIQTSVNFRNFADLHLRSPKTYHFQTWQL